MPSIDKVLLYKTVGTAIKDARKSVLVSNEKTGLSQQELADLLGLKRTSITNIEAGNQTPQLHLIFEICHILKVPLNNILPNTSDVIHSTLNIEEVTLNNKKRLTPDKTANYIASFSSGD